MFNQELTWWISMVEIPVFAAIFTAFGARMKALDAAIRKNDEKTTRGERNLAEQLSAFRVEVAMTYASISYIRDVEERLTSHLIRIEEKIARRAA